MHDLLPTPKRPHAVQCILALEHLRAPICLWGPPGVGKTEICRDLADARNYQFTVMHLNQMDPTDMKGPMVPDLETRRSIQFPPQDLPPSHDVAPDHPKTLILLDEYGTAPESIRKSSMELLQARRIGNYVLGPQHWVLLASNTGEDGVMHEDMDTATADRMCHLRIEPDLDDWLADHCPRVGIDPRVVRYIEHHPQDFHFLLMDAGEDDDDGARRRRRLSDDRTVRPTPRSWTNVSRAIQGVDDVAALAPVIVGYVGQDAGPRFIEYAKNQHDMIALRKLMAADGATRARMLRNKTQTQLAALAVAVPSVAGESTDAAFTCCAIAAELADGADDAGAPSFRAEMAEFIFHRLAQRLTTPAGSHGGRGERGYVRGADSLSARMAGMREHRDYGAFVRCVTILGPDALPAGVEPNGQGGAADAKAWSERTPTGPTTSTDVLRHALRSAAETAGVA